MIVRKPLPGERWMLYSPIGLRLLDDITGKNPFGPVTAFLDRQTPSGGWFDTKIKAVMTPSGYVTYPGLERHPETLGGPRRYRCRIEAEFYERSEEHTSELQSRLHLVCRLLLEKKKKYI